MAAPMVTAAAAMLYSYHDDITLADVKDILLSSVTKLDTLSGSVASGGMLNLGAAMAYDADTLPHRTWSKPAAIDSGTAPEIRVETASQGGNAYLVVQVTDADNDLAVTAYAPGALTAQQFQNGAAGKVFALDDSGKMTFSVQSSGVYTFYAQDSMGNETVKTVSVTVQRGGYPVTPRAPVNIGWWGMW